MKFAVIILFVATALGAHAARKIGEPFPIDASPAVVAQWNSFGDLPPVLHGPISVRASDGASIARYARVDILERTGRSWVWTAASAYGPDFGLPSDGRERGILVRFPESRSYLWSELPAHVTTPRLLRRFSTLSVENVPSNAALSLYLKDEPAPRIGSEGIFRLVPHVPVLACASVGSESRCAILAPGSTQLRLPFAEGSDARVLHVTPAEGSLSVLAKGRVLLRPRVAGVADVRLLPWVVVTLQSRDVSWNDVVIDCVGEGVATTRVQGSSLASPPAFAHVASATEHGLVVRAYLGKQRIPVSDPEAVLVVFPSDVDAPSVPLAIGPVGVDGVIRLESLASGTYRVKLISSQAAAETVAISMLVDVPADLLLPEGTAVHGRVQKLAGGSVEDPVRVEIGSDTPFVDATNGGDLTERMRSTAAGSDGEFRIAIPLPGRYRLRVRWGAASGERVFVSDESTRDIDLGDIVLSTGASLHGEIAGCPQGEANALVVPDPSKAVTFDRLSAPIDEDHFVIQGLRPGPWSVLIRCGAIALRTTPQTITVPESGDAVVIFRRDE